MQRDGNKYKIERGVHSDEPRVELVGNKCRTLAGMQRPEVRAVVRQCGANVGNGLIAPHSAQIHLLQRPTKQRVVKRMHYRGKRTWERVRKELGGHVVRVLTVVYIFIRPKRTVDQSIQSMFSHAALRRARPIAYTKHRRFMLHPQRLQPQQQQQKQDDDDNNKHPLALSMLTTAQLNAAVLDSMRRIIDNNDDGGDYYIFEYRGYECWCLTLRRRLVGVVRVPRTKPPLHWPVGSSSSRPFHVGIDIACSDDTETLVGFHTWHLSDTTSFPGVTRHPRSVDYVVEQLQRYIDTCVSSSSSSASSEKRKRKTTTTTSSSSSSTL